VNRSIPTVLLAFAAGLPLGGCAASSYYGAATRLQTQNPHAALEYAGLALQADPEHEDTKDLVSLKLLTLISQEHDTKVKALVAAGSFEDAIADCDRVVASAYLARTLPGHQWQIFHEDHRSMLAGRAAEKFYARGVELEQQRDIKEAARAYRRSLGFRTNYKDAKARYEACAAAAKSFLYVDPRTDGTADRRACDVVVSGVPRAARERGLEFLEFVSDPSRATGRCALRLDETFHDTGWQASSDRAEVIVIQQDPKTKQNVEVKKRARWTVHERRTEYRLDASFSVTAIRAGDPQPSGSATREASDQGQYANWSGDPEAVPGWVRDLPSSPVRLKDRSQFALECANELVNELGHQLFLGYK